MTICYGRFPPRALFIVILLLAGVSSWTVAGEAMKQGNNAVITWIDDAGEQRESTGKNVRYGYYERILLSRPRQGRTFKDKVHLLRGLPFVDSHVRFKTTRSVEFSWAPREGTDEDEELLILTRSIRGNVRISRGMELLGASHPHSPFIQFEEDGKEVRIDLLPLSDTEDRAERPSLVRLDITR